MSFSGKTWNDWASRNGVLAAYLHGSQTRRPRADSDVDVALLLSDGSAWEEVERIREEAYPLVSEALKVDEDRLDLQILNGAPPFFQYRVIACRQLLWEGDHVRRVEFEREATREYLDLDYYQNQHDRTRLKRLEEGTFGRRPEIHSTSPR